MILGSFSTEKSDIYSVQMAAIPQLRSFLKFFSSSGFLWARLLILGSALTGCASSNTLPQGVTQVGPYQVRPSGFIPQPLEEIAADPAGAIAQKADDMASSMFTQPISDPFIFSVQANTWLAALAGPNKVSQAVLDGQNYYRDALGAWNNPWQALLTLKDN